MKQEALIILWATLGIVFFSYVVLALKVLIAIRRERERKRALNRSKPTEPENRTGSCLSTAQTDTQGTPQIAPPTEQQSAKEHSN